jgi:hypothetical protein
VARITENPKFIGGAILLSLGLGVYLHGPDFWRKVTAPPPKPVLPAPIPEQGSDEMKFYRMVPQNLPDKWQQSLEGTKVIPTIFDEVPKEESEKSMVLPELTPGWHLSSIYISADERVAVISGKMVREGEILDPFLVESISEDRVVFRHALGTREMVVGQMVGMGEGKKAKEEKATVGDGNKAGDKKK